MASDGATVMLQCKAGLPVKQKLMFPNITAWHCLNHRLELGAVDAVRSRNETIIPQHLHTNHSWNNRS